LHREQHPAESSPDPAEQKMADRVRGFDWARTPLGPIQTWPASLRVAVELCLNNPFPMHVWWGPQLINIYNDAHIPVLGKRHPNALGKPASQVWPDVWEILAPQVEAVMHRGQSTWNERTHVVLERNGVPEDAWFTWSYSPIADETGKIGGLFCVSTEETAKVLAEQERDRLETQRQRQRATEKALAEEALRDTNTLLRGISDSTGDVIFAKDRQGRMRFANPAALALIGRPMDQILGKTDDEFLEDKESARVAMENDRRVMETGVSADFEEIVPLADGTRRTWFSRKMPHRDSEGNVIGLLGISRDITERKAAEDAARRAQEVAETASKAKDRPLAVVSHELRTPLNPILAITSHLEERRDLPADLREDLAMIRRNVEQEARIVDDLLSVTRLQRGKIILHHEAVDLNRLLQSVITKYLALATVKQINLRSYLPVTSPHLWADPGRLEQVLTNLLDNALKFTPERGSITIRCTLTGGQRVRIEISDTGVGIEPEVLPKLFTPFEQGEQTVTRRFGGLGLGLVIVKGIVDLHRGSVTATSAGRGKGSTVLLELESMALAAEEPKDSHTSDGAATNKREPLSADGNGARASAPAPNGKTNGARTRILLVEDHVDTLKVMRRIPMSLGYAVLTAANVREAMQKIDGEAFDLLVSDIGLPDGSGLDIMRAVRERKQTKGIALSGFGNDDDIRRSKEAGFEEHLVKPVNLGVLDSTLRKIAPAQRVAV
jgi:PAS domain S-box-containing protein